MKKKAFGMLYCFQRNARRLMSKDDMMEKNNYSALKKRQVHNKSVVQK
jgi:hypothetical protein